MLLLNAREVERLADMRRLVTAVEAGVREQAAGQVVLPPRLNLPNGRGFFRIMPTVMNGSGIMGFKAFHGSVQDGVRYFIAIYEQASGRSVGDDGRPLSDGGPDGRHNWCRNQIHGLPQRAAGCSDWFGAGGPNQSPRRMRGARRRAGHRFQSKS